jgi:hypothetical protein
LITEINRCGRSIKGRLATLPPPIEAPRSALHNLCNAFEKDLKEFLEGDYNKKDLDVEIAAANKEFLRNVKFSIAEFGLADYDEIAAGITMKSANDFLFEKHGIQQFIKFLIISFFRPGKTDYSA